jgi:hypothetical protein
LTSALNDPVTQPIPLAQWVFAFAGVVQTESTNYPLSSTAAPNWATATTYNGYTVPSGYNALITPATGFAQGLTNTSHSLTAWIVVTDSNTYGMLNTLGKTGVIAANLSTNPTLWRSNIDSMSIPPQAKSCIKVFSKTIPLE